MSISTLIKADIITAMKSKDMAKVTILRTLLSDIKNQHIKRVTEESKSNVDSVRDQSELPSDEDAYKVLTSDLKKMESNLEIYTNSGRNDLLEEESLRISIYKNYLPQQMTKEEIESVVDNVIMEVNGKTVKEKFPVVMKSVMQILKGRADGKLTSEIVKTKLGM